MSETWNIVCNSDTWIALNPFDDLASAIVQLQGTGPVLVYVTSGRAPAPTAQVGIILDGSGLMELPISGISAGDKIYVRSIQDGEENTIGALVEKAPLQVAL